MSKNDKNRVINKKEKQSSKKFLLYIFRLCITGKHMGYARCARCAKCAYQAD